MRIILLSSLLFLSIISKSQTADDVIGNYLQFLGGKQALQKIKSLVTKGEYDYGGIVFPFTTYARTPNLYKFIVPFEGKYYAQGYDGKDGWKIDAFKNETTPTLLKNDSARAMANEADVEIESPFINYEDKGYHITLQGIDTLEGSPHYKVLLSKKNGQTETYYFNTFTHALYLKVAIGKNVELQGETLNTYYSEYKDLKGLKFPFKLVHKIADQVVLVTTINEVLVNPDLKDQNFSAIPLK